MEHKNDYSVFAFFNNQDKPKRWSYVHNIRVFVKFLDEKHPDWSYINVYERRTRKYLKRFYTGNSIPDFLLLFFLTFNIIEVCSTFINGFNNPATIPILLCS
jgi:hypothetical protein